MRTWDTTEWQRTLAKTQEYSRNRVLGHDCDQQQIGAWRLFYLTYEPRVRRMTADTGLVGEPAEECIRDIWLEIMTGVPKLRPPVTPDSLQYWLSHLVRSQASQFQSSRLSEAASSSSGTGRHPARASRTTPIRANGSTVR